MKLSASTAGASSPSSAGAHDENGRQRDSRSPRVFARLERMRNIQVFSVERPSKRPMPSSTASHVSWTTSSATDGVRTYIEATLSMRRRRARVLRRPLRNADVVAVTPVRVLYFHRNKVRDMRDDLPEIDEQ